MDFFNMVARILRESGPQLLQATGTTMVIALVGTVAGCVIGLLVGVLRTIKVSPRSNPLPKVLNKVLQAVLVVYIQVFRGTPMMVQACVVYYGFMELWKIDMSAMTAAFLIVSINTGAYMAETVRGGIDSIPAGQTEGAMAVGMTHWQTMCTVIIPQTVRNILPQIGNNLIINIKDTSVLNVISVSELFFTAKGITGTYMSYFPPFFIASAIYLVLTLVCSKLLKMWERYIDGKDNYQLAELPKTVEMSKGGL